MFNKIRKLLAFACVVSFATVSFAQAQLLSPNDVPTGFAGIGFKMPDTTKSATVTTKKELRAALGRKSVIYVSGMIDMSEGMLPDSPGGSNEELDKFVSKNSKFSTYQEYVDAYAAACTLQTDDTGSGKTKSSMYSTMQTLNTNYGNVVKLFVPSNTIIIGLDENSGFKGAAVKVDKVSNVVLRNLTLLDAYDPFPHHEDNDGYNAQHDCISVTNSKNVWIDHCTIGDTLGLKHVMTAGKSDEKWQTYDGLCDITYPNKNVTVSYCKFMNHDKTMLIGSSDSEKIEPSARTVTLHHNYFLNCGQRLPMVRLTQIHIYNNFYAFEKDATYKSGYAIGVRYNAQIIAENNNFGSGISYSVSGTSGSKKGSAYLKNNKDSSSSKMKKEQFTSVKKPMFDIPYEYTLDDAASLADILPTQTGAGVLSVQQ